MHLGIPQIIFLILTFVYLTISVCKHNILMMKVENSYFTFTVVALLNGLLYWGGFYNK